MVRSLTNFFKLAVLIVLAAFISCPVVEAKTDSKELTYIKVSEIEVDGREITRTEIGVKEKGAVEDVSVRIITPNLMTIDLENTIPGKLNRVSSNQIEAKGFAEKVAVKETALNHTRIQINLISLVDSRFCKVYTEAANKRENLPFRFVIDVDKKSAKNLEDEQAIPIEGAVVIDPGHGGSDSGAVGPTGVTEKAVTLGVAKKVQRILEKSGTPVIMTRTTDRDVASAYASNSQELQARVDKAPASAAVFVSIHCNAFSSPGSNGMEVYYYPGSQRGLQLARLLNEELDKRGGLLNRGVKAANFYVLKHSSMPASLIELAFITNPMEERLLADDDYQEQLALAISSAINRFLNRSGSM